MSYDPSKPPLVSETLLKSRRSLDELAYRRSISQKTILKKKRLIRGEDVRIKRPEQFVRENRIVRLYVYIYMHNVYCIV